jgi:hypothetical protein
MQVSSQASVDAITEAAAGLDAWAEVGVGLGAVAALPALLFSSHPHPPLQRAAHHLLSTPPLLEIAVTTLPGQQSASSLSVRCALPDFVMSCWMVGNASAGGQGFTMRRNARKCRSMGTWTGRIASDSEDPEQIFEG